MDKWITQDIVGVRYILQGLLTGDIPSAYCLGKDELNCVGELLLRTLDETIESMKQQQK